MKAVGVVFSNIHDRSILELTRSRTMASVPFGARYRLIDFVLSAMVNSQIDKVGVITKSNYQSLMDHIGSGKDWDLTRKNGGVIMLPPYGATENTSLYRSRLEALKGIMGFLTRCKEDYVVMTDSDKIINIDYNDVMMYHMKNDADVTVVYHKAIASRSVNQERMEYTVADDGRIIDVNTVTRFGEMANMCLNIMVIKTNLLIDLVVDAISNRLRSFHLDVMKPNTKTLRIFGFEFNGYAEAIDSMQKYYAANMDMLSRDNLRSVFGDETRPIFTKGRDSAPTKYQAGCIVKNSLLADGCDIEGTVENSVLFRGVKVAKGAVVKNSILMQDTVVGEGANLNAVITDKNVTIRDRRNLSGCAELPYFIAKNTNL